MQYRHHHTASPLFLNKLNEELDGIKLEGEIKITDENLIIPLDKHGSTYQLSHRIHNDLLNCFTLAEEVASEIRTILNHQHNGHLSIIYLKHGVLHQKRGT